MKSYLNNHHRFVGIVCGMICLAIAIIYLRIIPAEVSSVSGYQAVILTYGHSVCWALLSGASIVWAILKNNKWSGILAYSALGVYVVFIGTLLVVKL